MSKPYFLTIITPVFNNSFFIEACMQNVIKQNCINVEHLIIDGASTDGTIEIVKKYAEKFEHIKWVSETDKGQSDAMNKGIKLAKGEIIGFLNADDGYFNFTLNRITQIFKRNKDIQFVVGNCKLVNEKSELIYINRPARLRHYHFYSKKVPYPINPVSYFYKKNIHENEFVGMYNESNFHNMDYEFLLKACLIVNLIYFNEDWGYMLEHPNAVTSKDVNIQSRKNSLHKKYFNAAPLKVKVLAQLYKRFKF